MKENKMYRLFRSLKPDENKQLKKVIGAPNSAATPIVKSLYKILSRQYPNFDSSEAGKQKLFAKLYPSQPYDNLKLRRYFSILTKFIIDFLNFKSLNDDTWQREIELIKIYENAGLYTLAQEKRQKLHAFIDCDSMKNDRYWKKKMFLYQMEYASLASENINSSEEILQKIQDASNYYFTYVKVRQAILIKSRSFVFNSNSFVQFLEKVKKEHRNGFLQKDALFKLYLLALEMMEHDREDIFFAYESLFFHKKEELYGEDQLLLFYLGLNYVVRQTNKGNNQFSKIALAWYKLALQEEILLQNNSFNNQSFSNIVLYGCRAGEEEWTLKFIKKYIKYLPVSIQEEELNYSNAVVYFYQNKYHKVIDNIGDYSFSQAYIIKTNTLLLCSYFEEFINDDNYFQVLIYKINSFISYLKRNKDWTEKIKKPPLNFCKILKKMAKLYSKQVEKEEINKWLLAELDKKSALVGKGWLLSKTNE